jgi:hypothetical protein
MRTFTRLLPTTFLAAGDLTRKAAASTWAAA